MTDVSLWPHQERVFDLLAAGKNVILQAPTGSGKTRAALYPFLVAQDPETDLHTRFPLKCIYSVPMRVLAKQFTHEYAKIVNRYNLRYGLDIEIAIQTGDQSRDPLLKADLIFATIDQTLSSFLLSPYSLPRSRANMNAAAVMSAYLVFDEFHLYDPISTLPTTLHMLRLLHGIAPFILMTATFSADMLGALGDVLGAIVVPSDDDQRAELCALESQQKTRRYHMVDDSTQPLSAQRVLDLHEKRSLVICNTVDRARHMHETLTRAALGTDIRIILLHSRFLREDRNRIEDTIRTAFGKDNTATDSLIVVSTQAIEVGVDITSTRLHTELAPANAILQRAGRCARYTGNEGDVYIYRHVYGDDSGDMLDLLDNVAPYMKQEDEFSRTLNEFQARDSETLDFDAEQAVITAVHGPRDRQIIDQLRIETHDHQQRMFAVMRGDEGVDARNLIRDINQQQVTIHANPDELLQAPFATPTFGLHPGTLQKHVKLWLEAYWDDDTIPWAVKWLKEVPDPDAEQNNRHMFIWEDVRENAKEILGAPLVVVHPRLATYDPDLGFLPNEGGDWQAEVDEQRKESSAYNTYRYQLETYARHIELVYDAAFAPGTGVWHEMAWLAHRLEHRFGWESGSIRRAAELAVLLHDVGKLNRKWQQWVRDYQQHIGRLVDPDQAYAHTDSWTEAHRDAERQTGKRPWHAVEGAVAALQIIVSAFGPQHPLTEAIFGAIARHHAAYSNSHQSFQLVADAAKHVRLTLPDDRLAVELMGVDQALPSDTGAAKFIPAPGMKKGDDLGHFMSYLVLTRVLRQADQLGTEKGAKNINVKSV